MRRSTAVKLPTLDLSSALSPTTLRSRPRSSSLVKVEEVGDRSVEEIIDRSAYVNINADWVNAKGRFCILLNKVTASYSLFPTGAWIIHVVLIVFGKVIIDTLPGMTQQASWTLVNLIYLAVRYSFHILNHKC